MVLDSGFRGNGRRLGTMNHAPTKTYPCQPYGPPAARGTRVAGCASTAVGLPWGYAHSSDHRTVYYT